MTKEQFDREYIDKNLGEWPFVRKGMSVQEYEEERDYFVKHCKEFYDRSGRYKPLWKQREEGIIP